MTTNLDAAGADILELLRFLEAKMKGRGWEKATADVTIRLCHPQPYRISLQAADNGRDVAFPMEGVLPGIKLCRAKTLSEAFWLADKAIAEMLDHPTEAMAPWFAPQEIGHAAE